MGKNRPYSEERGWAKVCKKNNQVNIHTQLTLLLQAKRKLMVIVYQHFGIELRPIAEIGPDTWVHVTAPSHTEVKRICESSGIPVEFITSALDPDERPRIEIEDNFILILLRIPLPNDELAETPFLTLPLSVIIAPRFILTICTKPNSVISDFIETKVRNFSLENKTRFVLQIVNRTVLKYLNYLKEINHQTALLERQVHTALKNEDLIRLMRYEKSLVYFLASLRTNQLMLERLRKSELLRLSLEDKEFLEDITIDNTQALEMTNIYKSILSNLAATFSSVISNNLNQEMKTLTTVTVILMVPTLVTSFYGMNVSLPWQESTYTFTIIFTLCILMAILGMIILGVRKLF